MLNVRPALREAVLLRDLQELTYHDIANRLTLPEGTVKSRINRGRRELARQIVKLESELENAKSGSGASNVSASGAHE
jgi:RNA polymerase sigma-70 factor (ECF subfamily)